MGLVKALGLQDTLWRGAGHLSSLRGCGCRACNEKPTQTSCSWLSQYEAALGFRTYTDATRMQTLLYQRSAQENDSPAPSHSDDDLSSSLPEGQLKCCLLEPGDLDV